MDQRSLTTLSKKVKLPSGPMKSLHSCPSPLRSAACGWCRGSISSPRGASRTLAPRGSCRKSCGEHQRGEQRRCCRQRHDPAHVQVPPGIPGRCLAVAGRGPCIRSAKGPSGTHRDTPSGPHSVDPQKSQKGPGASSSERKAAPTGAMITLTSTAAWPVSLRAMWPWPESTYPPPALTTIGVHVGSLYS